MVEERTKVEVLDRLFFVGVRIGWHAREAVEEAEVLGKLMDDKQSPSRQNLAVCAKQPPRLTGDSRQQFAEQWPAFFDSFIRFPICKRLPVADGNDWRITLKRPPIELADLIENHVKGFNTGNTDLFLSVFGETAIIVDGIAPYRWLNPDAPAKWLADVEKWRANLGVTYEHLAYELGFWNVDGSYGYAVISGTLTVTIKEESVVRTGTLAYAFAKHGEAWKIEAQAWGRTS